MKQNNFDAPESYRIQKTIDDSLFIQGIGLHSGENAKLRIFPADPNYGIVFEKWVADGTEKIRIPAHFRSVTSTELATSLSHPAYPSEHIRTVEHLMAAIYSLGITNLRIEMEGPEIPILDGSAGPFIDAFLRAGLRAQNFSTRTLKIIKPIKIYRNDTICELLPRDSLRLTTSVDFPHPIIGLQTFALDVTPSAFVEEVAKARTFGFLSDLERLRAHRLAQGASLENVLAFSAEGILNPEGMRFQDECVRHKLLDALGDLALCGCWIQGELVSFRGGHSIHLALLQSLNEHPTAWEIIPAEPLALSGHADSESCTTFELDFATLEA